MLLRSLLLLGGVIFAFGCSNSPKKASEVTTPAASTQVAAPVKTEPAKVDAAKNEMTCSRGDEKRLLEIENLQPKGCKLWYSRYETKGSVASSTMGSAYCEQVRENIRTNLVNAGFQCLTVQAAAQPAVATTVVDSPKNEESVKK